MCAMAAALFLSVLMMTAPARAQDASSGPFLAQKHSSAIPQPTQAEIEMQKRMAQQRSHERFAQLKKDTDHLLELATQLKKSVDEASDQKLSIEVIRKAEQIEKLAKQVRQKMAGE